MNCYGGVASPRRCYVMPFLCNLFGLIRYTYKNYCSITLNFFIEMIGFIFRYSWGLNDGFFSFNFNQAFTVFASWGNEGDPRGREAQLRYSGMKIIPMFTLLSSQGRLVFRTTFPWVRIIMHMKTVAYSRQWSNNINQLIDMYLNATLFGVTYCTIK